MLFVDGGYDNRKTFLTTNHRICIMPGLLEGSLPTWYLAIDDPW